MVKLVVSMAPTPTSVSRQTITAKGSSTDSDLTAVEAQPKSSTIALDLTDLMDLVDHVDLVGLNSQVDLEAEGVIRLMVELTMVLNDLTSLVTPTALMALTVRVATLFR